MKLANLRLDQKAIALEKIRCRAAAICQRTSGALYDFAAQREFLRLSDIDHKHAMYPLLEEV